MCSTVCVSLVRSPRSLIMKKDQYSQQQRKLYERVKNVIESKAEQEKEAAIVPRAGGWDRAGRRHCCVAT